MVPHPKHLIYSANHTWVNIQDDDATIGVTEDLSHIFTAEIDSVDLPMVGDELEMDSECMALHIGADVYHMTSPLTGRVTEVNKELLDGPENIFIAPYTDGWLFKMEYDEVDEVEMLMTSKDYTNFLEESEE